MAKRDKGFSITDECTKCRACEKGCPVGNIKFENTIVYQNKCEFCLSCIHLCTNNAIKLKSQKSKMRFINQNIKPKEIIDSNCIK